jgi:hypothetical protein
MCAKESIIEYNAPHRAHINLFITKALDQYFSAKLHKNPEKDDIGRRI